jgi:hypothetical protein
MEVILKKTISDRSLGETINPQRFKKCWVVHMRNWAKIKFKKHFFMKMAHHGL